MDIYHLHLLLLLSLIASVIFEGWCLECFECTSDDRKCPAQGSVDRQSTTKKQCRSDSCVILTGLQEPSGAWRGCVEDTDIVPGHQPVGCYSTGAGLLVCICQTPGCNGFPIGFIPREGSDNLGVDFFRGAPNSGGLHLPLVNMAAKFLPDPWWRRAKINTKPLNLTHSYHKADIEPLNRDSEPQISTSMSEKTSDASNSDYVHELYDGNDNSWITETYTDLSESSDDVDSSEETAGKEEVGKHVYKDVFTRDVSRAEPGWSSGYYRRPLTYPAPPYPGYVVHKGVRYVQGIKRDKNETKVQNVLDAISKGKETDSEDGQLVVQLLNKLLERKLSNKESNNSKNGSVSKDNDGASRSSLETLALLIKEIKSGGASSKASAPTGDNLRTESLLNILTKLILAESIKSRVMNSVPSPHLPYPGYSPYDSRNSYTSGRSRMSDRSYEYDEDSRYRGRYRSGTRSRTRRPRIYRSRHNSRESKEDDEDDKSSEKDDEKSKEKKVPKVVTVAGKGSNTKAYIQKGLELLKQKKNGGFKTKPVYPQWVTPDQGQGLRHKSNQPTRVPDQAGRQYPGGGYQPRTGAAMEKYNPPWRNRPTHLLDKGTVGVKMRKRLNARRKMYRNSAKSAYTNTQWHIIVISLFTTLNMNMFNNYLTK